MLNIDHSNLIVPQRKKYIYCNICSNSLLKKKQYSWYYLAHQAAAGHRHWLVPPPQASHSSAAARYAFHTAGSRRHTVPPPRLSSASFRFMSPTHTQPPPDPAASGLTAHLEWSLLDLKVNVGPGLMSVMSRTFQPSEQSEGRMPGEWTQNWTRRSDRRVGATQEWYRSDEAGGHAHVSLFILARKLKVKLTQDEVWPQDSSDYFY